jgi:signal transduction histidine kinase
MARSVVDLHGGDIAIHSAPGKGTRVSVRLPVEPTPASGAGA